MSIPVKHYVFWGQGLPYALSKQLLKDDIFNILALFSPHLNSLRHLPCYIQICGHKPITSSMQSHIGDIQATLCHLPQTFGARGMPCTSIGFAGDESSVGGGGIMATNKSILAASQCIIIALLNLIFWQLSMTPYLRKT